MAPPAGTIRPGRYLAFFLLIVVVLYGLVFFTGDRDPSPRLGIDLKGGTSVTLTARTPDGSEPTPEALDQARAIIAERVNGLGVSGAEVVLDGKQIVITVPGEEGQEAKTLGQTAKLAFRKVIAGPFDPAAVQQQPGQPGGDGAGDKPGTSDDDGTAKPGDGAKNDGANSDADGSGGGGGASGAAPAAAQEDDPSLPKETREEIAEAKEVRQNEDLLGGGPEAQQALQQALQQIDCSKGAKDPLRGNDDPDKPLVACDQDRESTDTRLAYLLGPVILDGQEISDSTAGVNSDGVGYQVNITFTGDGNSKWAKITSELAKESAQSPSNPAQVAFVLDTEVVSAPTVTTAIAGNTRITGNFTRAEAEDLAQILKYGSLPLSFETSDATTVSATLGLSSLRAGLIAGAIGFGLIVLYSLVYYRLLGVLLVASLGLTAALVFPVIILLGRSVGFTLDIAGVAGLIIAIGVTADSFVVYFERIKDEIRGGRSVRSAIPRAWVRSRRTILSADAVVLLAAVVLYLLAVGSVKGFAFTIGLTTVLDLVIVFMVTHPMLVMAGKWKILNNRVLSGLGMVTDAGAAVQRSKKQSGPAAARGV
ncbi:protein translocase subunit SecD [Haloechinothrix halophila]|uniref:protein translocase subunit SecD n=1 Tax=Haloechinothrix halophila TaxID=1069073 RepID=UPI000407F26B|nr:protein translocase subunit SecD [Haloechinothrix halophila]